MHCRLQVAEADISSHAPCSSTLCFITCWQTTGFIKLPGICSWWSMISALQLTKSCLITEDDPSFSVFWRTVMWQYMGNSAKLSSSLSPHLPFTKAGEWHEAVRRKSLKYCHNAILPPHNPSFIVNLVVTVHFTLLILLITKSGLISVWELDCDNYTVRGVTLYVTYWCDTMSLIDETLFH